MPTSALFGSISLPTRRAVLTIGLTSAAAGLAWGCQSRPEAPTAEIAFVARKSLDIRAELEPRSKVVATLPLGAPVEIVGRKRRSVRIQAEDGVAGWTHETELISHPTKLQVRRLAELVGDESSQGVMKAFDILNVHLEPSRESPTIYQLEADEEADLIGQKWVRRSGSQTTECWRLLRLTSGDVGWALGSRLYAALPVEVAQYAEGKRITAYFDLGAVHDDSVGEDRPTWLWTQVESGNSRNDFDRIRVFRWSKAREAYQTIKLERDLRGSLPVQVERSDAPGGEGTVFSIRIEKDGNWIRRSYKLEGQRVMLIGEAPTSPPRDLAGPAERPTNADPSPAGLPRRLLDWWKRPT